MRQAVHALVFGTISLLLTYAAFSAFSLLKHNANMPGGISIRSAADKMLEFIQHAPAVGVAGAALFALVGILHVLTAAVIERRKAHQNTYRARRLALDGFACGTAAALTGLLAQNAGATQLAAYQSDPEVYIFAALLWAVCGLLAGTITSLLESGLQQRNKA